MRQRGGGFVVSRTPTRLGPVRSRSRAARAARALDGATPAELETLLAGGPLPRLRSRLAELAACRRYEDAARLRDRIDALAGVLRELAELERLRGAELCLLAPAAEPGFVRAFFVAHGRIGAVRSLPRGAGALVEIRVGMREALSAEASLAPEDADELALLGSFLRRPPPELAVLPLDESRIAAACAHPWPEVA
ncbi:MAG TPA: hypothetical protein VHF23_01800 [Gaiellaceae bacterium]|nr:hypothetical protein [Gaiellaceae bacterium]